MTLFLEYVKLENKKSIKGSTILWDENAAICEVIMYYVVGLSILKDVYL